MDAATIFMVREGAFAHGLPVKEGADAHVLR